MSNRMDVAKAYEKALFAGKMDEVAGYFTEDPQVGSARRADRPSERNDLTTSTALFRLLLSCTPQAAALLAACEPFS